MSTQSSRTLLRNASRKKRALTAANIAVAAHSGPLPNPAPPSSVATGVYRRPSWDDSRRTFGAALALIVAARAVYGRRNSRTRYAGVDGAAPEILTVVPPDPPEIPRMSTGAPRRVAWR